MLFVAGTVVVQVARDSKWEVQIALPRAVRSARRKILLPISCHFVFPRPAFMMYLVRLMGTYSEEPNPRQARSESRA